MESNLIRVVVQVENLPNEILEKILEKLLFCGAGLSLLRCREVCKLWKDLVENGILNKKKRGHRIWYNVCQKSVTRNTALEFLNIGPSRFRGNDEDRSALIQVINNSQAPVLKTLNKIDINLNYEDGGSHGNFTKWKRLFFHCMTLAAPIHKELGNKNIKHESKNFRTDTLEQDPVTCLRVSGQLIITGHSTGSLRFWTSNGESLDCIPVIQPGNQIQYGIKSLNLVDAYQKGCYQMKVTEGRELFTDHHAITILSTNGIVYLCSLNIFERNNELITDNLSNPGSVTRFKSITHLQGWKISYVSTYGDVILAATLLAGKIFIIRLDTGDEHISQFSKVPEVLTLQMLSFTDISTMMASEFLSCNVWHVPGSHAWDWQCITIVDSSGSTYRCFLPNQTEVSQHSPCWRRFASLKEQLDMIKYGNEALVLSSAEPSKHFPPFQIVEPVENLSTKYEIQTKVDMTTVIGGIRYAILPENTWKEVLAVKNFFNQQIFQSCSIYRDDIFILITRGTNQLLVSVDGFYYRVYSPLKTPSFCGSCISAIHYTSNVLLLGTTDGKVRAYSVKGNAGIMNLDLDKPNWIEEPGISSFGKSVDCIHVGLLQEGKDNKSESENCDNGKVSIAIAHEGNSMTVIKRSLKFLEDGN